MTIRQFLRLVWVLPAAFLWTLLLLPVHLVGLAAFPDLARKVPVTYHRGLLNLFGVRVKLEGRPAPYRPLLIIANHVSWLDIVVLSAIAPVSFVAKSEMADWPLFGTLAKLQRTIFVRRDSRREAGDQAKKIADRLNEKDIIVLFPEGTTSDGHGLYPFKTPLFEAVRFAVQSSDDASAAVQPVTLRYERLHGLALGRQWRQHVAWPGEVGLGEHFLPLVGTGALDVTVNMAQPIIITGDTRRKAIATACRSAIFARLHRTPVRDAVPFELEE